ncbi:oxidoreductase, FAD/FMN dependent domain protein [Bordetella pertussis H973]|uniref:Oxidoreductase, FAD/FMN dependent domain protein n=2 Tax=Bordetella pertussis TaxID=520 RepID=A0AAI9J5N9_BORPT|nr:oxidoreductase, FAD/FMN dependent domain protein [Bordetella pertussis CHLA-11]ETH01929.1 oxidoreductase, FAD/FMN dependent domain protein [Bordetella pertussis 2250905]ETH10242.1 oxidoreductase, FAD/FMN dependent domain protein [Bordetella pertussis STO1-SEAT-0006]ETH19048.1 oxidoreductase, FAD/FMN dependent domain protein [Bordetella pertussis CHLA-13]ETH33198.1 oxidoreductase, FAD/FMN dependent domain protein [Bordetella pertussis CHLA-26]ETH33761.1 oxidoreductase, FAD/FMN dependent doma
MAISSFSNPVRMNHAYNLLNLHSYQAGLAEQVRRRTGMPVRAVGGIADPRQAQAIIETGQADQVALARAFLADPRWVWRAAETLGAPAYYAPQYRLGAGLRA